MTSLCVSTGERRTGEERPKTPGSAVPTSSPRTLDLPCPSLECPSLKATPPHAEFRLQQFTPVEGAVALAIACVRLSSQAPSAPAPQRVLGAASLPSDPTVSMLGDPERSNPLARQHCLLWVFPPAPPLASVHAGSSYLWI